MWNILKAKIDGVTAIRNVRAPLGEEDEPRTGNQAKWTTQDFYHGLAPKSFTAEWKSCFKTSTSIARYMVGRFVKAIEELGRIEIWNRRCEVTVDWERENGITTMSKRVRGRNCVGQHRRSRSDSVGPNLRQRLATEEKEIRTEADNRIVQSYLKQSDLDVMERLDSCRFLMTVDSG